jgi:DNA-binding NtrC family response regulator
VLIRGETGTGKGLVAKALHQKAGRDGKLVTIVCAGTNPELLGSHLFGHVEGAFTSANKARVGLIDSARDGTVFIDEIGDLDANLQITLLRVVEEKVFFPVGCDSEKKASARFVFATYCDLEELLAKGSFRQDLYARINRLVIELPPLRNRRADIPLLVDHLLERFKKKNNTSVDIGTGAVDELFRYDWPLNVRELDDVVCRAAAKATGRGPITGTMLRESIRDPRDLRTVNKRSNRYANTVEFDPLIDSWLQVDERAKQEYFRALAKVAQNMEHASDLSNIGRSQLYKIFAEYGLKLKP